MQLRPQWRQWRIYELTQTKSKLTMMPDEQNIVISTLTWALAKYDEIYCLMMMWKLFNQSDTWYDIKPFLTSRRNFFMFWHALRGTTNISGINNDAMMRNYYHGIEKLWVTASMSNAERWWDEWNYIFKVLHFPTAP